MDFLNKAKELADQHEETVDQVIGRIGDEVDDRTGGRFSEHIDKGVAAAQGFTGDGDEPA